jgi:hypothetical protein
MKALTVKQPWASLILAGYKDVENRTRPTKHRGPVAIHVAKQVARNAHELLPSPHHFPWVVALLATSPKYGRFGMVFGTVEIVGCVQDFDSPWALQDHWHWLLANPQVFDEPVPAKASSDYGNGTSSDRGRVGT